MNYLVNPILTINNTNTSETAGVVDVHSINRISSIVTINCLGKRRGPLHAQRTDADLRRSGMYLGASLGGQGVRAHAPGEGTVSGTAAVGGIFAGANFQNDRFVYGVEADLEYSGFNTSTPCGNPAWSCNAYVDGQGSIRGRFGFAVDTLLFYGTAGLAIANAGGSTTSPGGQQFSDSSVRFGWTVGAGVEAAFNENWFGRLEYRYTDLGERDMNFDIPYQSVSVTSHAVRAGIGYKF